MLVAALAAAVIATLAASQSQWLRSVELRRDQVQAQALVLAGLAWARQIIREDARAGPYDHLGEPWSLPLPPTPLENGSIEGRIIDAQGLLNLNNLAIEGAIARVEQQRLARLFAQAGLPVPRSMRSPTGSMRTTSPARAAARRPRMPRCDPHVYPRMRHCCARPKRRSHAASTAHGSPRSPRT